MGTPLDEITDRIRAATSARTPLRIRGGGSKDFYGRCLRGEVLDTRGLSGITAYEPSELYVTALAGTPLAELEAVLAEKASACRLSRRISAANPRSAELSLRV